MLNRSAYCPECHEIKQRRDRFYNHHAAISDSLPQYVLPGEICEPCGWKRITALKRICSHCMSTFYARDGETGSICHECQPLILTQEALRVQVQNSRAVRHGKAATLTTDEWLQTVRDFHTKCAYCQLTRFDALDHFVPLELGGETSASNCVPACRRCNSSKG